MSRKDYVLIASVVALIIDVDTRAAIADAFCKKLGAENPSFKRPVFMAACKVKPQTVS